jgi:hypothetical protein
MRFEWGSVQMKPALINFTLLRPLIFLRQIASNYLLSLSHSTQGGRRYRRQNRQKVNTDYLVIPIVTSVFEIVQFGQMLLRVGVNLRPQVGHKMEGRSGSSAIISYYYINTLLVRIINKK